jgi:3-deoxy-D-manno-octulosonate 8-phosphate phosphatase (KDO 8-P phosphatase)
MTGSVTATLAERIAGIELLVLDVDGVLTDGRIVYTDDGREVKAFHVRDGSGLNLWKRAGKRAAIVTGRSSPAVDRRAAELGVAPVVQGAADKGEALRSVLAETGFQADRACAVGDDLFDLPMLAGCGLAVAVADACPELRAAAHYVTRAAGGRGAVREVVELLLQGQGRWRALVGAIRG